MDPVKVIEIKKSIFEDNEVDANNLRKELKTKAGVDPDAGIDIPVNVVI